MTRSRVILVEQPRIPTVAPGTLLLYADNNELYMKDDAQVVTKITGNTTLTADSGAFTNLTATNADLGDIDVDTAQFGDVAGGNYSEFESDGTLVAVGDAVAWRDELQPLTGSRLESPSSDIVLNLAEGSVTFETGARYATDYVTTSLQLNHDWELGTNIHAHLHWWQVSANVPNWLLGYRWQKQGDTKTTSWTNLAIDSHIFTYSAGTLNQISEWAEITPPVGYGQVSDIVQFRIYRDVTNASTLFGGADPEAADVDAVNFDIHIEVDTLGSRQEYVK